MAAYEYSRTTPPFSKWKLPAADNIRWHISRSQAHFAQYWWDGDHHIEVSENAISSTPVLIEKVQHEMVHLHLQIAKRESKSKNPDVHNAAFKKDAARICRVHGWDLKAFC